MNRLLVTLGLALATLPLLPARPASAAIEDDLRDGDKFFEDGDWHKAAGAYDRAIAKAPGQVPAEAYGKRAAIFIILKDYKGGLDFLARAKARYPSAPEILEQEALILWETDRHDEAIKVAETFLTLDDESSNGLSDDLAPTDPAEAKPGVLYPPYAGSAKPSGVPMTWVEGGPMAGRWTLKVNDTLIGPGDAPTVSTLLAWRLEVKGKRVKRR